MHCFVGGNVDLAAGSLAQARLVDAQLAIRKLDPAWLASPAHDFAGALLTRLRQLAFGDLLCRELQHSLDGCSPSDVDDFVDGSPALFDEFDQRQHQLSVLAQQSGQLLRIDGLRRARFDDVVLFFHGGSPFC